MRLPALLIAALSAAVLLPVLQADEGPSIGEESPATLPARTQPAPTPATATAPATAAAPATAPDDIRAKLFGDPSKGTGAGAIPAPAATRDAAGPGTVEPVGPGEPKTKLLLEDTFVENRVVRLTRDDKLGQYLVTFDADGKEMRDPPMIVLPNKALASMEDLSQKGTRAVRFRVTGQVTEYKGKNYVLILRFTALRDLNSGLSGG